MTRTVDLERFKNSVGFVPQFRCKFGNLRKANVDKMTLEAKQTTPDANGETSPAEKSAEKKAKSRMTLRKQLIVSPEYDAIKSYFGELRAWIYSQTVPSFFKEGFQLASLEAVEPIEKRMRRAVTQELPELVKKLVAVYPAQVEEARSVLEPVGQWNARDYPSAAELPGMFEILWNWIAFVTPAGLPPELRAAEQGKLEKQMADAADQITQALRVGMAELIQHAQERLTPGADGKQKIFRDSVIGNISDFMETFNQRNITNDVELAQLVAKAREVLQGVTPQKLRESGGLKEKVIGGFSEIKAQLDTMIVTKPARLFDLGDDEPAAPAPKPEGELLPA